MAVATYPSVFHLAGTKIDEEGLAGYLDRMGAPDWTTDAVSDGDRLVEVAGRGCYRSFGTELNKNLTRVREGNEQYVGNLLRSMHGSVLEHATDTFALVGVSRIVTHELVRHRAGVAVSQESGRFIRIDQLGYYRPEALGPYFLASVFHDLVSQGILPETANPTEWSMEIEREFSSCMDQIEAMATKLESKLGLDHIKSFDVKKKLQSAVRRLAPNGMVNTIVVTANHRAWRHIVAARTAGAAEEEIRLAQWLVFKKLKALHPSIYQDALVERDPKALPASVPVVSFENQKV